MSRGARAVGLKKAFTEQRVYSTWAAGDMCDICIEVDGGDGESILASAQVC
jgi:hypothetical protein